MNPNISTLAAGARGKRWRSRLIPFESDIRRLRADGESYQAIAAWVAERGLIISASAIHGFVRSRARRGRGPFTLPVLPATVPTETHGESTSSLNPPFGGQQALTAEKRTSAPKAFIFKPKLQGANQLTAEDLELSDPLA